MNIITGNQAAYMKEYVDADVARGLQSQLAELRELYELDTQWLRSERDEAREALRKAHNEYIEVSHDREYVMDALRAENAALADALHEVALLACCAEECGLVLLANKLRRIAAVATEQKAMQ